MGWLKKRLPKKLWKRVALFTASTLFITAAADMGLVQYWRRITISPETTRVVSPLTAAGTPDYIAALNEKYGRSVTPENNAAELLLKAMGKAMTEEGTSTLPTAMFVNFPNWVKQQNESGLPTEEEAIDQSYNMAERPWKRMDHPLWGRWLDEQAEGLAIVRRAVGRPEWYVAMGPQQTGPGEEVSAINYVIAFSHGESGVSLAIIADAMRRVEDGDGASFRADVLASLRLARLMAKGPTIYHVLIAYGVEAQALRAVRCVATTPGLLAGADCRKLLDEMEVVGPIRGTVEVVDCGMRWMVLDSLSRFASRGWAAYAAEHIGPRSPYTLPAETERPSKWLEVKVLFEPVNFNARLRDANAAMDEYVAALRLPSFVARYGAVQAMARRYELKSDSTVGFSQVYSDVIAKVAGSGMPILEQRTWTEGDLTRVVLALAAYHGEHGEYPEKLDLLRTAGIMREVPLDGFSDAPFVYERRGEGYVLYTVGYRNEGEVETSGQWRVVRVK